MRIDRREFLNSSGKFILLTSAAAAGVTQGIPSRTPRCPLAPPWCLVAPPAAFLA